MDGGASETSSRRCKVGQGDVEGGGEGEEKGKDEAEVVE